MKKIVYSLLLVFLLSQAIFAQDAQNNQVNNIQPTARAQADNEPIGINPQAESERKTFTFFGFKLGGGFSDIDGGDPEVFNSFFGYVFGFRMMYFFNNTVGIIADLEYEQATASGKYWIFSDITKFKYIGINAVFAFKFGGGFIGAGFYTKFLVSAKVDYYDSTQTVTDNFNTIDFGFILTLGYIFSIGPVKLFTAFEFKQGITNISKSGTNTLRNQCFYGTFGLGF